MKLFQSILTEKALNAYKTKKRKSEFCEYFIGLTCLGLKFIGLPHLVRFGVFDCGPQSLRFIAMPLYHTSLQTYIDSKTGKVIGLTDVYKILPIILDAYDYLHSEVSLSIWNYNSLGF
jgi:hypothetical protein